MRQLFKSESGTLKSRLAKNALGSFGLKIASVGFAFVTSVVLARLYGPEGYGVYAYINAWLYVLLIPASLGMQSLVVREVASYQVRSEWELMHGLLRWANQAVLYVSIGIALLAVMVVWLIAGEASQTLVLFGLALISLPFLALTALRQATLQGLHRVVVGQFPETFIQPALFIVLLGAAYVVLKDSLSVTWAMGLRVFSIGVAFFVGAELLRRNLPQAIQKASPNYQVRTWTKSVIPFILISSMYAVNNRTDTIMLGAIEGTEAVGLYVVASRGADLISFILIAVNKSIGPTIAKLYADRNISKLQRLTTKSSRVIFLVSLPIALSLIAFGYWFLLLFGSEFTEGRTALTLLCVGQLVNAGMGSVGLLLNMTGHERDTAIGIGASGILNIILNALLIPKFGLEGAATATAISTILWNVILIFFVHKKLKINPTAIKIK